MNTDLVEICKIQIDNDNNSEICDIFKVQSVPSFYLLKNKECINTLKGADINGIDLWGMTGLHWEIQCHPELSRYLIEQGADIRIRDAQHVATQLSWALHFGNNQLADYMIENCSIDIVDAINLGKENVVRKILTGDPELVDGAFGLGEPLRMAAKRGNEAIIEILLSKQINEVSDIIINLKKNNINVVDLNIKKRSLESIFVDYIRKKND